MMTSNAFALKANKIIREEECDTQTLDQSYDLYSE